MNDQQLEQAIAGTPAPRVTKEGIESRIDFVKYEGPFDGRITFAFIHMKNGFVVTGESACVSAANYNAEIGQKIARDNAFAKLWALEGYLLAERLSGTAKI